MKAFRFFSSLMFFAIIAIAGNSQDTSTTTIYIIGTKHIGNAFVNPDSFIEIFNRIKPDIILVELDSGSVKNCSHKLRWGAPLAKFLGIYKPSKEDIAVMKYRSLNRQVCVKSFDIVIPKRRKYIKTQTKNENRLYGGLNDLFFKGRMLEKDSIIYNRLINLDKAFWTAANSSLEKMNDRSTVSISKELMKYKQDTLQQIIGHYPQFKSLQSWHKKQVDFWAFRNQEMCRIILDEIKENKGKKIIVLTGLLHKYFLVDCLKEKESSYKIKIADFAVDPT